jgi:DNA-directed RNA polymerase subunit RPC12/RpoP
MAHKLSKQEELFAQHYLLTRNGRQSAIQAGYSESNASQCASRLLKKERVRDEIKRLEASTLTESNITRPMLEAFYVGIMMDKALTVDQRLKASDQLCKIKGFYMRSLDMLLGLSPDEIRRAIDEVKTIDVKQISNG